MNFATLRSFVSALLFRRRMERDMEQEWQFHLNARIDDLVAGGLSRTDAEQRARLQFGNPLRWKEWGREVRGVQFIDELRQDVTYAMRHLSRAPTFTVVAVVTLALGIGANTAIFSVVNAVLLRPLPYSDSDSLVRFIERFPLDPGSSGAPMRVPGMDLIELDTLRTHSQTLSHVAVAVGTTMILAGREDAIRLEGAQVSSAVFPMLGVQAHVGRTFDVTEDDGGANSVILLSHALWQQYFGSDPTIVGRVVTLDGTARTVIGVMPSGFAFPDAQTQLWVPFVPPRLPPGGKASRPAIARVRGGVTLEAAAAEVNAILAPLHENPQPPARAGVSAPPRFDLVRMQDWLVGPVKPALLMLAAAVGFVLLIACVNVANLLLARMAAREREFAVRLALGAGRGRLIRQVLTESLLLALVGGIAGTALAFGGLHLLRTLATSLPRRDLGPVMSLPRLDEIGVDESVLIFTLAVAVLTGVVFGLPPAVRHSAHRSMDALRDGPRISVVGFDVFRRLRMPSVLVIAEIAMAIILCIGGGLLMHSFIKLANVDPGYDLPDVLTFQVSVPKGRYNTPSQLTAVAEDITARLRSVPGLGSAGYTMNLPMVTGRFGGLLRTAAEPPKPLPPLSRPSPERPLITPVSWDFLTTLGIRVIAGRGLSPQDGAGQRPVMLINQTVVRSRLLGDNPVGKQVYALGAAPIEIVGVVEDIRMLGVDQEPVGHVFVDFRQFPPSSRALTLAPFPSMLYYAVRIDAGARSPAATIRALVRQVERQTTVDNFVTMQQLVSNSIARPRLYAVLLGIFGAVAVALAAVGIYGVMAYSVTRRTREIGIRMALGAGRRDVISLVLGQSLGLIAVGIAFGLIGAAAVTRYLGTLLFRITPLDPMTFIVVAVVFGSIATLAATVPTRRAAKVDPLVALRYE
jgi:putative ABC transport system permease protein